MKALILSIFILLIFPRLTVGRAGMIHAVEDPLVVPNNKFGIHIIDENDLEDARKLVNSTGGDWGYTTIVIREDERDAARWQNVFDKMREMHLIPIVRLATIQQVDSWQKPSLENTGDWVRFLNSLNWVIKNRYIIVGNEPNHAKEWGGAINPKEYAEYLKKVSEDLKLASPDFFILPAGFDASAPNSRETMNEEVFIQRMLEAQPLIFNYIDGWTSHSYPNPGFSGSELASGKGSLLTFDWELSYLKSLGIEKKLPVFITETGWVHSMDGEIQKLISPQSLGSKFKTAFELPWSDQRIAAITPFILSYKAEPFSPFSWIKKDGGLYDFYYDVQNLPKIKGEPVQINSGQILTSAIAPIVDAGTYFHVLLTLENTGQTIWLPEEISLVTGDGNEIAIDQFMSAEIKPGERGIGLLRGLAPNLPGSYSGRVRLASRGQPISPEFEFQIKTVQVLTADEALVNMFTNIRDSIRAKVGSIWYNLMH